MAQMNADGERSQNHKEKGLYRGLPQWPVGERILQEETKETKKRETESKPSFVPSSAGSRTHGVGHLLFLRAVDTGWLLERYCFSLSNSYCLSCANPHLASGV